MTEELPDTMGSLTRHASVSSADTPQDPNPLGVMEQQEAEKGSKRRKASAEDDPLVTGLAQVVGKMDRGHEIMSQMVTSCNQPERPLNPRQAYAKYIASVLDVCSEAEFRLLRVTINGLVDRFGLQQHPVSLPYTTSLAHTYPVPSSSAAPLSSYPPMTPGPLPDLPPMSLEQTLAELTSTASSQPTMSFLRTTLGTPDWDTHDPGAGPSGL